MVVPTMRLFPLYRRTVVCCAACDNHGTVYSYAWWRVYGAQLKSSYSSALSRSTPLVHKLRLLIEKPFFKVGYVWNQKIHFMGTGTVWTFSMFLLSGVVIYSWIFSKRGCVKRLFAYDMCRLWSSFRITASSCCLANTTNYYFALLLQKNLYFLSNISSLSLYMMSTVTPMVTFAARKILLVMAVIFYSSQSVLDFVQNVSFYEFVRHWLL